jgi:hypothetical protein
MFRVLSLLLALLLPGLCFALEIRRVVACCGVVLRMRGDIKEGDYSLFKSHLRRNEPIVGLDLSSDGGDLEEGLLIANLVHRKKLVVYVSGECNSVCAFIFFSAEKRYFGRRPRIGVQSVSSSRDIEDTGSILLTVRLARLSAKLGVSSAAIGKMVITRPKAISYLDQADLSVLHASAGDPFHYREKSSEAGEQLQQSCSSMEAENVPK